MKKIILITLLSASIAFGEVTSIVPYFGVINYSSDAEKSDKDSSLFGGFYTSYGSLNYLLELGYSHLSSTYKDETYESLEQDDITLTYSIYYNNFMYKVGLHHVSTNDTILGNGNIFIATLGGYKYSGYDKYSYGLEGYYSLYSDIESDSSRDKAMTILQITPYFNFYKKLSRNVSNSLNVKLNYEIFMQYLADDFVSFEVSDTLYYKSFFTTLKAYGGEMRSGVKDGGMSVYNSLDIYKDGYGIGMGYYIEKNFILSLNYNQNNYLEYAKTKDTSNAVAYATLSLSF